MRPIESKILVGPIWSGRTLVTKVSQRNFPTVSSVNAKTRTLTSDAIIVPNLLIYILTARPADLSIYSAFPLVHVLSFTDSTYTFPTHVFGMLCTNQHLDPDIVNKETYPAFSAMKGGISGSTNPSADFG